MACECVCFEAQPRLGLELARDRRVERIFKTLPSKDLKQLGDSIVSLLLINKLEKDVVDGASDKGTEVEEFAVDPVKGRLQEIALARILTVKQLQQLW